MESRHDDRRSKTRTWLPLIQTKKINLDVTGKKVYFISDLHLGAKYINNQHDAERRVTRWLDSVKDDMAELYLLGDILDYWYEYKYVVPRGFVRFFGKIAELADAGIPFRPLAPVTAEMLVTADELLEKRRIYFIRP